MAPDASPRIEVVRSGPSTTIQDAPGRTGFRPAGIPTSGAADDLSFRLGNRALGNDEGTAGLEIASAGPTLRFAAAAVIMVTGAPTPVMVDSAPADQWQPLPVAAGSRVELGAPTTGTHAYLVVRGGIGAPELLGSAATFDPGRGRGRIGRPLLTGDVIPLSAVVDGLRAATEVPVDHRPTYGREWQLGVLEGPHGAPDFFTAEDAEAFYAARWTVHDDVSRTGIRLVGPASAWARRDGGDAGLHPSAIHPTPYAVGAVAFAGDLPVVLGPDGPSLGGFACPATVVSAHRWRLGQLAPGDTVRFVPVNDLQADDLRRQPQRACWPGRPAVVDGGVLHRQAATRDRPRVTFRRNGDDNLLIDFGEMTLDLGLRLRVHALAEAIGRQVETGGLVGVVDITPGVRSLQLHVDPARVRVAELLGVVRAMDDALPPTRELSVPSRTVRLPLCWDDPTTREAITRYTAEVRTDAPWCPDNIDFLRRINGLASVDDVSEIVFAAEYLVLGLGHGGPGAPVATPIDPRHRLMTTRYNPTRRWTPADAVGIGGGYLGINTLAGPGSDQLIGRTLPIWTAPTANGPQRTEVPWLLRCFDRISWYPVHPDELLEQRAAVSTGSARPVFADGTFSMVEHEHFITEHTEAIAEFAHVQSAAFAAQRHAWQRTGELDRAAYAPA